MRWLFGDGDLWLLLMMLVAGLLPVISDLLQGRVLGGEATVGGLIATVSAVALLRRVAQHWRAAAMRRRLMR
ncbi:MAG: hypothetical protein IPJ65_39505 [Archangiaceae bacterium]|nr:hypothetical protein [Archangiaceae bacterium]